MATSFEKSNSRQGRHSYISSNICAEFHPRLSILNLYITSSELTSGFILTIGDEGRTVTCADPHFVCHFEGICFTEGQIICPFTISSETVHVRLVVNPQSHYGSSTVEILKSPFQSYEDTLKKLFQLSQNRVCLSEGKKYVLQCLKCGCSLGQGLNFNRVRELPSHNWEEKANDMWFCHPPHGDESTSNDMALTVEDMTDSMLNVHLNSPCKASVFQIVANPDTSLCLFGPSYWIINSKLLDTIQQGSRACCRMCESEIGIKISNNSVQIWSSSVNWGGIQGDSPLNCFKRIIAWVVREANEFRTKILIQTADEKRSLFLWSWDPDSIIYIAIIEKSKGSMTLKKHCAMKCMYTNSEELVTLVDIDVTLRVPAEVYDAGLNALVRLPITMQLPSSLVTVTCAFLMY